MNSRETNANNQVCFSPFWPQCLVAVSLAIFLGWQVTQAARQYIGLVRLSDQQAVLMNQAAQAEGNLQAMMKELIELSLTDSDAKAIVTRYHISFNPAQASGLSAETSPGRGVRKK